MSIAERIMNLRKKEGWSQEELADRLGVSRQSVSKWESGASVPDINRILEMSELFGVSTDHLLKGEGNDSSEAQEKIVLTVDEPEGRRMTSQEINSFMEATATFSRKIATGVTLCIISPSLLIGLAGLSEGGMVSEKIHVLVGIIWLLAMIAVAVSLFIRGGTQMSRFQYVKQGNFYLEQQSINIIEGVLTEFEPQFSAGISKGVALCILSPAPLIAFALIGFPDTWIVLMVVVLLIMVSVAVNMFIRLSIVRDGFLQLLKRKDFDPVNQENAKREEKLGSIYWPIIVAAYLLWSFSADAWHISWMIFPIAGLIFAALSNAVKK